MAQEYIKNPDLLNYTLGEDYIRDEKLNDLVKGKTIAMVGPAPNLQGSAMGEFIDSHDLIFRVGDSPVGFLGQNDRCVDYGSRSDVLVHSFNDHDRPQLQQDIQWLRSLKYLLQPMVRSYETPRQLEWFKMVDVPVHHVPDHHMKSDNHWNKGKPGYLYDYLGSLPNTGFIGILAMLNYDIKYMYITGYTFYNMGKWSNSGPSYFDNWYETDKFKAHGLNESQKLHNPNHYIQHFRDILKIEKHRDKIKLDTFLTENFDKSNSNE
jgi:hypothetical protein